MISVLIKEKQQQIIHITNKGLSLRDEFCKDLICASVSTAITGIINEMMKKDFFKEGKGCYELNEGFADIIVYNSDREIQVVLETLVTILETIEDSYPKYLRITKKEVYSQC